MPLRHYSPVHGNLASALLSSRRVRIELFQGGPPAPRRATRRGQRTAAGEEGELRLGYIGPPTQAFLGRIVKEFRCRYSRVTVVLEERTPERVWEMVPQGRLAIGLTRPVLAPRALGLPTLLLLRERLCAAFPAGHPLAKTAAVPWRELVNEPLIVLSRLPTR